MYPDLTGKTAVVTGASSGLGHGIAQRFLQQEGMNVVVNYHSEKHRGAAQELADACNANGRTVAVVVQADISQEEGAQKLLDAALDTFGTVDVWVLSLIHISTACAPSRWWAARRGGSACTAR